MTKESHERPVVTTSTEQDAAYERFVEVASCGSRIEADLKASACEAAGEHVVVASDDVGGLHPELAAMSPSAVRLMTPSHRVDAVRGLLAELESGIHALPSEGEHEAITGRRASLPAWSLVVGLALIVALFALRILDAVG